MEMLEVIELEADGIGEFDALAVCTALVDEDDDTEVEAEVEAEPVSE